MNRYVIAAASVTVPVIVAAAAFALGGGNDRSSGARVLTSGVSTASASNEVSTSAAAAGPAPASPEPELEDGRHFGFIEAIDLTTSPTTAAFDLAYRLDGEEANEAAAARGYPIPVDNDYFIVNDNPELRTVALSPNVEILLIDWNRCCDDSVTVDPERFQASFGHPKYSSLHPEGEFSQYWVTVAGGSVVKIEEQYQP